MKLVKRITEWLEFRRKKRNGALKPSELLSNPKRWTKGTMARNRRGDECCTRTSEACCWCLVGALYLCCKDREYSVACTELREHLGITALASWNDEVCRTHAEVLAALRACGR